MSISMKDILQSDDEEDEEEDKEKTKELKVGKNNNIGKQN